MNIQTWYGGSISVPKLKSGKFSSFATSCLGIVRTLLREKMERQIHIVFQKGGTGAANQEKNEIRINEEYLQGNLVRSNGRIRKMNSEETLTLLLGLTVHEANHFVYSPKTLAEAVDYIQKGTTSPFIPELAAAIANVVEDVFIESASDIETPSLTWMLDGMNDLYFDNQDITERLESAAAISEPPTNPLELAAAGNVIILAKVLDELDGQSDYINLLFGLTRMAALTVEIEGRYALALDIYNRLMENFPESECQGNGGEGDAEEVAGELKRLSVGATIEPGAKQQPATKDTVGVRITKILEELPDAIFSLPEEDSTELRLGDIFIEIPLVEGRRVQMDRRYVELAVAARQNAVVNRPYGMDRNRGHNIRKLHRIATDSKIFAEPMPTRTTKPMQVLILVDCSSSMRADSGRDSRIEMAKSAALGAALGLLEGGCEVAVYGHTSEIYGEADVVVYRAKGFREPFEGLDVRLGAIGNLQHRLVQNRDGCAIRYIYPKLNDKRKRRLLIVISDGEPLATEYYGRPAQQHTKSAVEEARAAGVEVLSISISHEAKDVNNWIYGRERNVYNEDINVIQKIVESLVLV